jgi:hypothetical protein
MGYDKRRKIRSCKSNKDSIQLLIIILCTSVADPDPQGTALKCLTDHDCYILGELDLDVGLWPTTWQLFGFFDQLLGTPRKKVLR